MPEEFVLQRIEYLHFERFCWLRCIIEEFTSVIKFLKKIHGHFVDEILMLNLNKSI